MLNSSQIKNCVLLFVLFISLFITIYSIHIETIQYGLKVLNKHIGV